MMKCVNTHKNFVDLAKAYVGQPVAVLCVRFQYRGVLSHVTDDCLVLAKARAVEVSGPTSSDTPNSEDKINGTVVIKNDAVEILYQPKWCYAPLED